MTTRRAQQNPNSIFDTFSSGKKIGIFLLVVLGLASTIFFNVPTGLAVFAIFFLLPLLWKDPQDQDPIHGMMTYGSKSWKVAEYMSVIKGEYRSHIFSPLVTLGFGPPEDDIYKDLEQHFLFPPTRLSSYWGLGFGLCMSGIDYLIHPYLYPLWDSDFTLPVWASMVISTVFYYMLLQAINATNRYYRATLMSGVDHTPAVMFNKLEKGTVLRAVIQGIITAVVGGAVATVLWTTWVIAIPAVGDRKAYVYSGIVVFSLAMFVYGMFRNLTKVYREEFMFQVERREAWNNIWEFKKNNIPFFEMEVPVPGEIGKPGGPPEGTSKDSVVEPHVWVATFSFPAGTSYVDFANDVDKIKTSVPNAEMMCITPIPRRNNQGETVPGTVSNDGFRVWWSDEDLSLTTMLTDRDVTDEHKEIALRVNIIEPLAAIRAINRCIMHSHVFMTAEDSPINIMRVTVVPPNGVTDADFMKNISKIKSSLGVDWVRAKSGVDSNGRTVVHIYVGDGSPNNSEIIFPRGFAANRYKKELLQVDWEYVFAVNKVASSEGRSPSMMMTKNVMGTSNQIVFDLPAGVSLNEVMKKADALKTTSGNNFLEVYGGITDEKRLARKEKREIERYIKNNGSISQFTMVASPTHPLEKVFLFSEWKDELITGREKGVTKIAWSPGVKANGTLAVHDFNKDMPHLVLAGSSGSGKSVLIYSMICQLIANNGPEDLQIWIIDPKIGYQNFEGLDSVTRYVDQWTPSNDFFENCRDLMAEAVEEMNRRNGIFRFAQRDGYAPADSESIDKLSVARRIGLEQGPLSDGSPNPLVQPYIFIIIDEAAMLFAGATDPETKELQKEILYYAVKIFRESRSAGIHVLLSTQYPTKESIPSIIKQQSGRLGLKTQDNIASRVIIDQDGLEQLTLKGEGMLLEGADAHTFRGFLMEDDGFGETSMSDIINNTPRAFDPNTPTPVPGSSEEEKMDIPLPETTLFNSWDSLASNTLNDASKKDPNHKLNELLYSMSDEEFNNLTLDEFKKMMK